MSLIIRTRGPTSTARQDKYNSHPWTHVHGSKRLVKLVSLTERPDFQNEIDSSIEEKYVSKIDTNIHTLLDPTTSETEIILVMPDDKKLIQSSSKVQQILHILYYLLNSSSNTWWDIMYLDYTPQDSKDYDSHDTYTSTKYQVNIRKLYYSYPYLNDVLVHPTIYLIRSYFYKIANDDIKTDILKRDFGAIKKLRRSPESDGSAFKILFTKLTNVKKNTEYVTQIYGVNKELND